MNYLTTKEEKQELLKSFQALDLNGDGQLSKEELIAGNFSYFLIILIIFYHFLGYTKIMNAAKAEEEVERIMKTVDTNHSGSIDYTGIDNILLFIFLKKN